MILDVLLLLIYRLPSIVPDNQHLCKTNRRLTCFSTAQKKTALPRK